MCRGIIFIFLSNQLPTPVPILKSLNHSGDRLFLDLLILNEKKNIDFENIEKHYSAFFLKLNNF